MGKRKVLLRGLFAVGLVAVLCAYGLATEQSANKNQNQGTTNQNQGAAAQQNRATAQPGASQRQTPPGQTAQAMTLVRTSELIGKEVKGTQGETLGRIHDIVLAPDYQSVSYVALSYGGVFGINSRLYAIPWQALRVTPGGDVTMAATKDQFSQAPGFTNRNWPSQAETRWLGAGAGTTGSAATSPTAPGSAAAGSMTPGSAAAGSSVSRSTTGNQAAAGQSRTGQSATAPGQSQTTQAPPSSAMGQMPAGSQEVQMRRVTHLTGMEVKNTENQDLGDVEGFAINTSDGRIMYGIISFGGVAGVGEKYAAVPANALRIQAQNHVAILNATRQTLDSVAFNPSEFPDLSSPEYQARLSRIFPAAPAGGALGYVPSQQPQMQYIADQKTWSGEGMHGKAFNPSTVKTITGTVESIGSFKPEGAAAGTTGGLRLRVKTTGGQTVIVYAGPVSYAEQKEFFVMPGDQITITGSEAKIRSRSIMLASELKKDGKTLELRDKSGKPLWSMGGAAGQRSPGAAGSQTRQD
jgi:sporulation protein YlmC with PRC-barrel domain